ncbi:fungal-specific transcription factor domain-containing protein [Lipomyces kononenkoae]
MQCYMPKHKSQCTSLRRPKSGSTARVVRSSPRPVSIQVGPSMSTSRRLRSDLSERACLQCQKRKTRCVSTGIGGACSYCTKMGKPCVFDSPPTRTPLTRKNLDVAEARCKELERRLRQLQPDIKLDDNQNNSAGSLEDQGADQSSHSAHTENVARESVEAPAELGLEWQETFGLHNHQGYLEGKKIQDGMVSQAAGGYVGNSSGSSVLEGLLPSAERRGADDAERPRPIMDQPSPVINLRFGNTLATSLVQDHLIDAYFVAYNSSYPILHERTFREQCRKRSVIPAQSPWHIVYYMVLAIGEWVNGYCTDDHSLYYETAHARIRTEILESGNMVIVQALLLLGNYLQKRDRPNTGYNFIGIAYRVALGLGLHREMSSTTDKRVSLQRRRLLFWTLYCFDSGFSITTGRPIMVADSFIDVHKPKNVDDSQCQMSSPLPPEVDYPTTGSAIIAQARLAVIANKISTTFLAAQPCADVNHSLAVMEHNLQNWRCALPAFFFKPEVPKWFIGPRQVVLWKEANLRILLLLASQRQQTDEHDKAAIGVKYEMVALQTIFDITEFCEVHADVVHIGLSWYAVYFLLQAVLALSVNQLRANSRNDRRSPTEESESAVPAWETSFSRARQCLEGLGHFFNPSTRTLWILDRLRHKIRKVAGGLQTIEDHSRTRISTSNVPSNSCATVNEEHGNSATVNFTANGHSATTGIFDPSPDAGIVADFIEGEWVSTVDPSLHMFLDDVDSIDNLFQGIQGFPNTLEMDDFSYTTSGINTMRMAYPPQRP